MANKKHSTPFEPRVVGPDDLEPGQTLLQAVNDGDEDGNVQQGDPAVAVVKTVDAEGNVGVQIITLNGLDQFAVPTLLRYAIKLQEQNLGIG
jgi:hypothetical protein